MFDSLLRRVSVCLGALVALASLVPACASRAAPVVLEQYCDRYTQLACDAAARCGCLDGIPVSACRTFLRPDCESDVEAPVRAGRRRYLDGAGGECLAALGAIVSDCSLEDATWPDACDAMLAPAVAPGAACESSGDCVGGLDCFEGVCTTLPVAGGACLGSATCSDGHYCDADGVCRRDAQRGEPCPSGARCAADLYCNPLTTTCDPYLGPGASCAHATYACASGLYCSPATGACRTYPGLGGDCEDSSGACSDALYCDAAGICRAELPDGASCTESAECRSSSCVAGACEPPSSSTCPFL